MPGPPVHATTSPPSYVTNPFQRNSPASSGARAPNGNSAMPPSAISPPDHTTEPPLSFPLQPEGEETSVTSKPSGTTRRTSTAGSLCSPAASTVNSCALPGRTSAGETSTWAHAVPAAASTVSATASATAVARRAAVPEVFVPMLRAPLPRVAPTLRDAPPAVRRCPGSYPGTAGRQIRCRSATGSREAGRFGIR
ncbi:hypothetical protein [Rubrobacter tropicus]|uniref:hypothetical protein n=1 Tax=Rubrobacter tropicus TaxID=2653851 RepID=UPI001D18B3BB|nr:hypothetical protein [Rubrobacter tropicus]